MIKRNVLIEKTVRPSLKTDEYSLWLDKDGHYSKVEIYNDMFPFAIKDVLCGSFRHSYNKEVIWIIPE